MSISADYRQEIINELEQTGVGQDYVQLVDALLKIVDEEAVALLNSVDDLAVDESELPEGFLYSIRGEGGVREMKSDGSTDHMIVGDGETKIYITEQGADNPTTGEYEQELWLERA